MILWISGAVITAVILGGVIGDMIGSGKGYSEAMRDSQEQITNAMWTQYFNQFQRRQDEISDQEDE